MNMKEMLVNYASKKINKNFERLLRQEYTEVKKAGLLPTFAGFWQQSTVSGEVNLKIPFAIAQTEPQLINLIHKGILNGIIFTFAGKEKCIMVGTISKDIVEFEKYVSMELEDNPIKYTGKIVSDVEDFDSSLLHMWVVYPPGVQSKKSKLYIKGNWKGGWDNKEMENKGSFETIFLK